MMLSGSAFVDIIFSHFAGATLPQYPTTEQTVKFFGEARLAEFMRSRQAVIINQKFMY